MWIPSSGPNGSLASWIPLIASLGSATAAVVVVFLFVGFMRDVIKDRGAIIHEVSVALDRNTKALDRLEMVLSKH